MSFPLSDVFSLIPTGDEWEKSGSGDLDGTAGAARLALSRRAV
jgi:hypothetical protein